MLFQDLVARARHADDPAIAVADARAALALWRGEPWTPGDGFDWVVRDLLEDRAHAERIAVSGTAAGMSAGQQPRDCGRTADRHRHRHRSRRARSQPRRRFPRVSPR